MGLVSSQSRGLPPKTGPALSSPCNQSRDPRAPPSGPSLRPPGAREGWSCLPPRNAHVRGSVSCPRCDSAGQLKALLPGLEREFKDTVKLQDLYQLTFTCARSRGQKGLLSMPARRRSAREDARVWPAGLQAVSSSRVWAPLAAGTVPRAPAPQPAVTPDVRSQK